MGPLKTTELANQENVRLKQKDNTRTVDRRPVALEKKVQAWRAGLEVGSRRL